MELDPIVVLNEGDGPIVATAIHDGHALRQECAERIALDETIRFREEDPYTGRIARLFPTSMVVTRSRFEVDLNRPREKAVYTCAADAWNLEVWREPPPPDFVARSLAEYDAFYRALERLLRDRESRYGRFVVLDIHSYNYCREGPGCAADPSANPESAGYIFGQRAAARGVIVLNDPSALALAINKMYFENFPEAVRPRSLISRDAGDLWKFVESEGGRACLKPLQGSGGTNVFVVKPNAKGNLNQIIEAVTRDGYAIAQEFLPAAKNGDTRLMLMNGQPLVVDGKFCAFRRISSKGDVRSNLHAGGRLAKAVITDEMLQIAEIVRPKLTNDGMFLVGLDLVGDKLMEINVFSPGGLGSAGKLEKVDFSQAVIDALERKAAARIHAQGTLTNRRLATL